MSEDDPIDVGWTGLEAALFGKHPLGRPVAGTVASVTDMQTSALRGHYRRYYTPYNYVITVVGSASHRSVVSMVTRAFGQAEAPVRPPRRAARHGRRARSWIMARPFEQVNILRGYPGLDRGDQRRYAMGVLHSLLGGGMSSRLFQEVRERRGLAYSVSAFRSSYSDAGIFGVHAGCAPEKLEQTRRPSTWCSTRRPAADSPTLRSRARRDRSKARWCSIWRTPGCG